MCNTLSFVLLIITVAVIIAFEIAKGKSQQLVQTVYLGVAVGAIICPLLAQPFLSEIHPVQVSNISNNSRNLHLIKFSDTILTLRLNDTILGHGYYYITATHVMYFYLMIGCFLLIPSFIFLCLYLSERKQHDYEYCAAPDEENTNGDRKPLSTEPIKWSCSIVVAFGMLLLFGTLFYGIQDSIGNLLTAFVVKCHLHLQKKEGVYLTMFFWMSIAVGRLFGIFLANCFKPATMLVCELTGSVISTLVILVCYYAPYFQYVLWGMICLFGLSLSTVNASIISWAAEKLKYERYTVNIVVTGHSIGLLAGPSIIAALFKSIGPISLMAGSGIVMVVIFLLFITMMLTVPKHPDMNVNKADSQ